MNFSNSTRGSVSFLLAYLKLVFSISLLVIVFSFISNCEYLLILFSSDLLFRTDVLVAVVFFMYQHLTLPIRITVKTIIPPETEMDAIV